MQLICAVIKLLLPMIQQYIKYGLLNTYLSYFKNCSDILNI